MPLAGGHAPITTKTGEGVIYGPISALAGSSLRPQPPRGLMKARQLIDGASFGPEALKVIGQALDDAWASIAPGVASNPLVVRATRLLLADAILSVATEASRDTVALKEVGL